MERLVRVRSNLQIFKRHQENNAAGPIDVEIQGIRIGDFVLLTFPGELFAEVGLGIKERSPMPHTFVAGYSNGHQGYAPTAKAYGGEAYEDALTQFCAPVASHLRGQSGGNYPAAEHGQVRLD